MLAQIHISNLVTIQELHLDLLNGTTVITGETGAGKSILIDAIELALGSRINADIIRPGQDKADISLVFDIDKATEIKEWLKSYDLNHESGECIIRRTITKEGRSRSYINGMPTTLQPLRELSEMLISIHGQHEHQALLKSEAQRKMLDRFAGHDHLVDKVAVLSDEWHALSKEIKVLEQLSKEHKQRGEFLKFQLQELEELNLTCDEFATLDLEHKQLAHAEELLQNINYAIDCLSENESANALHLLNQAAHYLEVVRQVDPKVETWIHTLQAAIVQINDTHSDLRRYLDSIDIDPERLEATEERISLLFELARKHKVAPQDLYDLQQKLSAEYMRLENSDETLSDLKQKLDSLEKHYHEVAHKLGQSRLKAAKRLATEITQTVNELALPQAEFHVLFEIEDYSHPAPHGMERVIFQIKTNPGQDLQPLAKIASGGELSRISLAIHLATAGQHTVPTMIFDEVDVGIGGGTAEIVGKLLRRLSQTHQVLCITHAPQVAAQGHQHLRVKKVLENNTTYTHIQALSKDEKVSELARMLGGVEITKTTLDHAREMLESMIPLAGSISRDAV